MGARWHHCPHTSKDQDTNIITDAYASSCNSVQKQFVNVRQDKSPSLNISFLSIKHRKVGLADSLMPLGRDWRQTVFALKMFIIQTKRESVAARVALVKVFSRNKGASLNLKGGIIRGWRTPERGHPVAWEGTNLHWIVWTLNTPPSLLVSFSFRLLLINLHEKLSLWRGRKEEERYPPVAAAQGIPSNMRLPSLTICSMSDKASTFPWLKMHKEQEEKVGTRGFNCNPWI